MLTLNNKMKNIRTKRTGGRSLGRNTGKRRKTEVGGGRKNEGSKKNFHFSVSIKYKEIKEW